MDLREDKALPLLLYSYCSKPVDTKFIDVSFSIQGGKNMKKIVALMMAISVKVSTGPAQGKMGAQIRPCKQLVLQGQSIFNQS